MGYYERLGTDYIFFALLESVCVPVMPSAQWSLPIFLKLCIYLQVHSFIGVYYNYNNSRKTGDSSTHVVI